MTEHRRQDLAALLATACCLLDEQRGALRQTDFARLLATTSAFQRLMHQIESAATEDLTPELESRARALRRRVAGHQRVLGAALAATPSAPDLVAHQRPSPRVSSLLLDHHA